MTLFQVVLRSIGHHWRSSLGIVAGAAVATAILTGALAVGDSVRQTLRRQAAWRLGHVAQVIEPRGRLFPADLADRLAAWRPDTGTDLAPATDPAAVRNAPVLQLAATAIQPDSGRQANHARVMGVDRRFWHFLPAGWPPPNWPAAATPADPSAASAINLPVLVSTALAQHLHITPGAELVLRIDKPGGMSKDAPLSTAENDALTLRLTVTGLATPEQFGRFGLTADPAAPYNLFVPLDWLQARLGAGPVANLVLLSDQPPAGGTWSAALRSQVQLADFELSLAPVDQARGLELRSRHVFLDPTTTAALQQPSSAPTPQPVLTYFVNAIRCGERMTPYSMVAAMASPAPRAEPSGPAASPSASAFPADLRADEILLNAWLAEDLAAQPGDRVEITYYVMGPMRQLFEKTSAFTVRAVLPMNDPACDRELMPAYPGIAESENCRDWDPGMPIDLDRIRDRDEDYWDTYRGTPKAFIALAAGQTLWNNRFGNLTGLRFNLPPSESNRLADNLVAALDPADFGLAPQPAAAAARAASVGGQDFGGLFLGLSFFLIVAALLLLGLLFAFAVEQRNEQIGVLAAVGWPVPRIRRLFLCEGALLATLGALLGVAGGLAYTRGILFGLAHGWSGAVNTAQIDFHVQPSTLAIGGGAALTTVMLTLVAVLRGRFRRPIRELLNPGMSPIPAPDLSATRPRRRRAAVVLAWLTAAAAGTIAGWAMTSPSAPRTEIFFGVGSLLMIAGLLAAYVALKPAVPESAVAAPPPRSLQTLGWRNATLRPGRSLATVAALACGCFLVIAVGASRPHGPGDLEQASSPTGGFRLYAELTLPVYYDLNSPAGRTAYGLDPSALTGTHCSALRVHRGDDASCLNLNRAQSPRLLGAPVAAWDARGAFHFIRRHASVAADHPWLALDTRFADGAVPAVGDEATVFWGLGLNVGDTLMYTDGRGRPFPIRIVGMLQNSILQGALVIAEQAMVEKFPEEGGYSVLLVDAPADRADALAVALARGLRNNGCEVTAAAERLARFNQVEQTYLAIFGMLGGLGMLLGTTDLGLVLMRNVLERRSELAILRAVGFSAAAVRRLLLWEHGWLLGLGWTLGVGAALAAIAPSLIGAFDPQAHLPLAGLVLALLLCGGISTWLATCWALRGPLISALRDDA